MQNHLPSDDELRAAVEEAAAAADAADRATAERAEAERAAAAEHEATRDDSREGAPPTAEPTGEVVYPSKAEATPNEHAAEPAQEELATQLEAARGRLLRSAADFDNFRKRVQREREDTVQYANETILRDLLPVLDNLERAVDAGRSSRESDILYEGVRMVVQQFHALLDQYGVRRVPGVGDPFDPAWHEAMQQMPSDKYPPGSVLEELQPGYMYRDRLLRPALVIVSSRPKVAATPPQPVTPPPPEEIEDVSVSESGEIEVFEEDTMPESVLPGFEQE